MTETEECPICYEEYKYDKTTNEIKFKVALKCKHSLCLDCLNQLIIKKCPLCRGTLELQRFRQQVKRAQQLKKINNTDLSIYLNVNNGYYNDETLHRAELLRILNRTIRQVNISLSIHNLDTIHRNLRSFLELYDDFNDINYLLCDTYVDEILYTVDTLIYYKVYEEKPPDFYDFVSKLLEIYTEIIKFKEYYQPQNVENYNKLIDTAKIMLIYDSDNPAHYER